MPSDDDQDTWKAFRNAVNMTASELEKWLKTDKSKEVGQKSGRPRIHRTCQWTTHRRDI